MLAKEGFNVVLVGRSKDKLQATRDRLAAKYERRQFETRQIDLSSTNVQDYINLGKSLAELDVALLVNNAGYANLDFVETESYEEL